MAGSSLGVLFRVTNWGESHGPSIGVVVEGIPPGLALTEADIQHDLDRRKPGQSHLTTSRQESDKVQLLSGLSNGTTTGTPVLLLIANKDQRPQDYTNLTHILRPSHADFTYLAKYGLRTLSGGGRSSARLTAGSVAAGAIAKKILAKAFQTDILAYVRSIEKLTSQVPSAAVQRKDVNTNLVRTTDSHHAQAMIQCIEKASKDGDSLGGIIECRINSLPAGLGEPLYDKLEADLAKAILGINACKGFELGAGFKGTQWRGSEHNDAFVTEKGTVRTTTNHSGGIQGGISNGMPIIFRAAFKPTATILKKQRSLTHEQKAITFQAKGRHDPCVLPRAVPIVEAMAAIVCCDHFLRQRGQVGTVGTIPPPFSKQN